MDENRDDRLEAIERRLDLMEARLIEALDVRMNSLESRLFPGPRPNQASVEPTRPTPPPPPPIVRPVSRPVYISPSLTAVKEPEQSSPPREATPVSEAKAEIEFGKRVLPILAAVLMAAAMIGLTSELIKRGVLTPQIQFLLSILATISLLAVGAWAERKEKIPGQLLTGLGALGGYLTAGAGHFTFHQYSDQTALGLFFAWAMLVSGYGFVRTSKPFAILGLAGGLIASYGARTHLDTALALNLATFLSALAVAFRRRWSDAVGWSYGLATLAIWTLNDTGPIPIVLFLGQAALATLALIELLKPSERILAAVPAGIAAVFVFLYADWQAGSWVFAAFPGLAFTLAIWGGLAGTLAFRERDEPTRNAFALVAFVSTGLVAPGMLPPQIRLWIWMTAMIASAVMCVLRPSYLAGAAQIVWIGFLLGGRSYLHMPASMPDVVFWPAIAIAHLSLLRLYLRKPIEMAQNEGLLFLFVSFPLLSMAAWSVLTFAGLAPKNATTLALAFASFSLMAIGFRAERLGARYAAWVGLAITVGKFLMVDLVEVDPAVRIAALFVIGAVAFGAGAVYARRSKAEGEIANREPRTEEK